MDRKRNTYEKRLTFESIQPEEKEETDPTDVPVKYMLMCKCNITRSYLPPEEMLDKEPLHIQTCPKCHLTPYVTKWFINTDE